MSWLTRSSAWLVFGCQSARNFAWKGRKAAFDSGQIPETLVV
jgi:hypothetical protein